MIVVMAGCQAHCCCADLWTGFHSGRQQCVHSVADALGTIMLMPMHRPPGFKAYMAKQHSNMQLG